MATSFTVNVDDLQYILKQIQVADLHASGMPLVNAIMQVYGVSAADAALLPAGLRTVDGSDNNLLTGQSEFGAAGSLFPRLLDPVFLNDADGDLMPLGPSPAPVVNNNNYGLPGSVADADPRIISNLIVNQTAANPAAVTAALAYAGITGAAAATARALIATAHAATVNQPNALLRADAETALTTLLTSYGIEQGPEGGLVIPNLSPDIGLSPSFNAWMTFFGQFFDHGLDLVTKGGNGTIYIPLQPDDPLIAGADKVFGTGDDLPPQLRFMALTRATPTMVDPDGSGPLPAVAQHENTTTSFVDQNQTYTSHASHQVFLREYMKVDLTNDSTANPIAVSTGHLLDGSAASGSTAGAIGNWAEVKAQALTMLGIKLTDFDVGNVPLLKTDQYGRFIPGANGYAQMVMKADAAHGNLPWFKEGTAAGITTEGAELTGHAFLNNIAHHAAPGFVDLDHNGTKEFKQIADSDIDANHNGIYDAGDTLSDVNRDGAINTADFYAADLNPDGSLNESTYDDEMLNAHFVTGDGRGNENIALSTVHSIFHSEHNRLVEVNKATILASGDLAFINEWLLVDVNAVPASPAGLVWDGDRLFQAARFVTEMQYQHLVFEEFARRIQPNVDPFVFTNSANLDPSILAEFAHVVYRFGHSMLTDTVDRLDNSLATVDGGDQATLIEAFLNPQMYLASGADLEAINANIIRGLTRDVGNEIDEFVVPALQTNLLGLPLDLPALNIARGRDTGVPSLNETRAQIYADFGAVDLKPYTSWIDFAQHIKNPISIVNFIAAYGTHASITGATTLEAKRNAAMELVLGVDGPDSDTVVVAPSDRTAFLNGTGAYASNLGGLNNVDLWVGGLAEELNEFGGMLGSTFNFIFEYQMEHLQNGDRLYYLSRTQGLNLLNQLEPNTFSDMVMRNTDLGDLHSTHVNGVLFVTPDHILELDPGIAQQGLDPEWGDPFQQAIDPKVLRIAGTMIGGHMVGGTLKFSGGEHVVLGGTEGNDRLYGDKGIDTLWGDGGDDYLNPGMESDQVFGGDGDDIIEDPFGDDFLRGEAGNDVIVNGAGLDILFGGTGNDFIMAVTDTTEVFAGEGNDFILGGTAPDGLMGNEGDDWIEGGEGFDGLSGENSQLFFNSTIVGHDILNGQGNDTDYDGENGDDIMFQSAGIQRNNGMDGFDWAIHKGDAVAADSDLGIRVFDGRPALILRDRFDSVEGLSGWKNDDILTGAAKPLLGENFADALTQDGVNRIVGMRSFLDGVARVTGNVVFESDTNIGGEIILGGDGSDTITGNLGNDILDGDAWLNVRISIHQNKNGTGPELATVDTLTSIITTGPAAWIGKSLAELMRAGTINPGQLEAVREILYDTTPNNNVDKAVFTGNYADYAIEGRVTNGENVIVKAFDENRDGFISVTDNVGTDGTDLLKHIEMLQFADQDVVIAGVAPDLKLKTVEIGNYFDQFGTQSYANSTGLTPWTTSWVETSDNNSVADGQIQISSGVLLFDAGDGALIQRNVNLAGWTTATLSFDYDVNGFDPSETVTVQFATDGINFTDLQTLGGTPGDNTSSFALTGNFGANSAIRFVVSNVTGNSDNVTIDNVRFDFQRPVAPSINYATSFTEDGAPIPIASMPVIADSDSPNMASAKIVLTNSAAGDTLSVGALPAGITSAIVSAAGQITVNLSGSASLAAYQTAIQDVRFVNTSQNPGGAARLIEVTVNDGSASSNIATTTVTVVPVNDAPATDLNGAGVGTNNVVIFTEPTPRLIAPAATVTDIDSANLASMTVTLTNRPNGGDESLTLNPAAIAAANGLTVSYTAATGVLLISGAASPATYQAILQGILYNNSSEAPITTSRSVAVVVNDGALNSALNTATVNVIAVNDAPTATITAASYSATEQINLNLHGTGLSVADVDAGTAVISTTLSVTAGILTVAAGNSGASVNGSGTSSVTFTGTLIQINNLLGGGGGSTGTIVYNANSNTPPVNATLTLLVNDNGATGGGAQTATDTAIINITAVDDPMVANDDHVITNITDGSAFIVPEWALLANDIDVDSALDIVSVTENSTSFTAVLNSTGVAITHTTENDRQFTYAGTGTPVDTAIVTVIRDTNNVAGGGGNDIIVGNGGSNTFNGFGGNDIIFAGAGNDTINWNNGDGRDFVDGGTEVNATGDRFVVNGSNNAETYRVYARAEAIAAGITGLNTATEIVITRNGTNNASIIAELTEIEEITINTNGGDDTVIAIGNFSPTNLNFNTITVNGNTGNDTVDITGLMSAHRIVFNSNGGNDTVVGARAQDVIDMDDILNGTEFADVIDAGTGVDIVNGLAGNDILHGGNDNDTINGGKGNDTLVGGTGNDSMDGGRGNDTFVFDAGFGDDTIRGFDANGRKGQDLLDISSYGFDDPGEFAANVSIADMGHYTVVTIGDDTITFLGVTGAGNNVITQADFII